MIDNPVQVILTIIFLLPGFICIFLPRKIIGVKLRYSNFELTTLSLIISILIVTFSIILYHPLHYALRIKSPDRIEEFLMGNIGNLTPNSSIIFFGTITVITLIFFFIGMKIISKDIWFFLRKKMTRYKVEIRPEKYVWDSALKAHKGHAIIQTENDEYYLGFIEDWMIDEKEKELLLKYPEYIDMNKNKRVTMQKHMGFNPEKIIFLDKDIKRIYLLTDHRKNK